MATRRSPKRASRSLANLLVGLTSLFSVLPAAAQDAPNADPQDQAASDMPTLAGAGLGLLAGGAFGLFYSHIDHPGLPDIDLPQEIEYVAPFALAGLLVGLIWAWGSPEVTEGVEVSVTPSLGRSDASPGDRKTGWRLVISFRH